MKIKEKKTFKINLQMHAKTGTTKIADVIEPTTFTNYVVNETMELSELINAGIAVNDPEFDELASGPSTLINMPFWNDLTGEAEIMDDNGDHTPGKLTTGKDMARRLGFVKSFGANALSGNLAGDDPMKVIGDRFAAYWARFYQEVLLSTLDGVFAAENMTDKILDITSKAGEKALLTGSSFIDATQIMGDAKDSLTGITIHSAVEAHLAKRDLIDYRQESDGAIRVPYFMNKRVIVDDAMAYDTETQAAEMYLFGQGAIAWGNGSDSKILATEVVRDGMSKAGEDILVNRKLSILHPRGVAFQEATVAGTFPKLDELETGSNWKRVYEPKKIRIVKFMFKIGDEEI